MSATNNMVFHRNTKSLLIQVGLTVVFTFFIVQQIASQEEKPDVTFYIAGLSGLVQFYSLAFRLFNKNALIRIKNGQFYIFDEFIWKKFAVKDLQAVYYSQGDFVLKAAGKEFRINSSNLKPDEVTSFQSCLNDILSQNHSVI